MTKSELIQRLAECNPHLYQRDVELIVTAIFDEITAALSRGDRVELRGFGAFSVGQFVAWLGAQRWRHEARAKQRRIEALERELAATQAQLKPADEFAGPRPSRTGYSDARISRTG